MSWKEKDNALLMFNVEISDSEMQISLKYEHKNNDTNEPTDNSANLNLVYI